MSILSSAFRLTTHTAVANALVNSSKGKVKETVSLNSDEMYEKINTLFISRADGQDDLSEIKRIFSSWQKGTVVTSKDGQYELKTYIQGWWSKWLNWRLSRIWVYELETGVCYEYKAWAAGNLIKEVKNTIAIRENSIDNTNLPLNNQPFDEQSIPVYNQHGGMQYEPVPHQQTVQYMPMDKIREAPEVIQRNLENAQVQEKSGKGKSLQICILVAIVLLILLIIYLIVIMQSALEQSKSRVTTQEAENIVTKQDNNTEDAGMETESTDSSLVDLTPLISSNPQTMDELLADLEEYGISLSYNADTDQYENETVAAAMTGDGLAIALWDSSYQVYDIVYGMDADKAYQSLSSFGKEMEMSEEYDSTVWHEFNLYDNLVFVKLESAQVTYLAVVIGGTAEAQTGQGTNESVVTFAGTWWDINSQRCHMEISSADGKNYDIEIGWASSASEDTQWSFVGTYDETAGGIVYHGSCVDIIFSESGQEYDDYRYTDGSGFIWIADDGMLYWNDYTEDAGAGCVFEKDSDTVSVGDSVIYIDNYTDSFIYATAEQLSASLQARVPNIYVLEGGRQ